MDGGVFRFFFLFLLGAPGVRTSTKVYGDERETKKMGLCPTEERMIGRGREEEEGGKERRLI